MLSSSARLRAAAIHGVTMHAAQACASGSAPLTAQMPRAKTLRRENQPLHASAARAASWLTELHVRLHATQRSFAAILGIGKTRAFHLVSLQHVETITLGDLLTLAFGEDTAGRKIARGILRDAAMYAGAVGGPVERPAVFDQLEMFGTV